MSDSVFDVDECLDALSTSPEPQAQADNVHRTHPEPIAWSVAQTASALGLSIDTTYKLINAGRIPARRIGCRLLVPTRRLTAWINDDIGNAVDRGSDTA